MLCKKAVESRLVLLDGVRLFRDVLFRDLQNCFDFGRNSGPSLQHVDVKRALELLELQVACSVISQKVVHPPTPPFN